MFLEQRPPSLNDCPTVVRVSVLLFPEQRPASLERQWKSLPRNVGLFRVVMGWGMKYKECQILWEIENKDQKGSGHPAQEIPPRHVEGSDFGGLGVV